MSFKKGERAKWASSGYVYGQRAPSYGAGGVGTGLSTAGIGTQSNFNLPENKYQSAYEKAYNALANREKFKYSQQDDPLYQQYQDMYTKQAKLGMQDTVGQISALTGGYANSYAETAGQAMYQNIMNNMNEKALDLYDAALRAYNSEGDRLAQTFNAASTMYGNEENRNRWSTEFAYQQNRDAIADARYADETAYNRSIDSRNWAYQLDRDRVADERYANEWQYQKDRDTVADRRYDQEWEYQKGRDTVADRRYDTEWKYQQERDKANDAYRNAQLAEDARQFDTKYDYDSLVNETKVLKGNTPNTEYFKANGGNVKGNSNNNKIHSKAEFEAMIEAGNKSLVVTTTDKKGKRHNEYFNADKYGSVEKAYEAYINAWVEQTGYDEDEKDYLVWYYTH